MASNSGLVLSRLFAHRSQVCLSPLWKTFSNGSQICYSSADDAKNNSIKPIVYTGDNGQSTTLSGIVKSKDNRIFHAIGATEELTCYLGYAKEIGQDSDHEYVDKLKRIQTILIDITTYISKYDGKSPPLSIGKSYTKELEEWINEYSTQVPPAEQFVIPGGGKASAWLHVTRSVCRKTERIIIPLVNDKMLDNEAQIYLNRLSDFLFTVARMAAKYDKRTESVYVPKPDEKVQPQ